MSPPPRTPEQPSSAPFDLATALKNLPTEPGVYRMYNVKEKLIYVGKAKNLRNRVRSYFQKNAGHSPKVSAMVAKIARFDTIITDSEVEALIVENNLIKRHKPRYNVLMKDDSYPWLGFTQDEFPRIFVTRSRDNARSRSRYFGPFLNTGDMYRILEVIKKNFPLRQRKTPMFRHRPCMNYYIGTCPGPCQGLITAEEYRETMEQVGLFLRGRADKLLEVLETQMQSASEHLQYERAATLRNRYRAVQQMATRQKTFYDNPTVSQDIVAAVSSETSAMIQVLNIRRGKLIGSHHHEVALTEQTTLSEAFDGFLERYYVDLDTEDLPDEIVLGMSIGNPDTRDTLSALLKQKRGRKLPMVVPSLGVKEELVQLALKNAREQLHQAQLQAAHKLRSDPTPALMQLQEQLKLPQFPARMECYDISHFQGQETVASMVVFENGVPNRQEYRRFKIRSAEGRPDDFKSMGEVIRRRFQHSSAQEDASQRWPDPDLVIIDGGKGQLAAAVAAMEALGVRDQAVISLAKKFEEIFVPDQPRPVLLARDSRALFLLQQIRDEAHRFAITYHRKRREKAATQTTLDTIPGVGPKMKQKLLTRFGSLTAMNAMSEQELRESLGGVPGLPARTAAAIVNALQPLESDPANPV
ncbi:MAG: excinuclease ABC subunit UvrC [Candidatus Melainabacteria bacterium]